MTATHDSRTDREETPAERADRNWNELLQELRVTQTGVQILTGFLLTVPFTDRFQDLTQHQRVIYLTVLAGAVLTTCSIVAPVAFHRVLFRQHEKLAVVTFADRVLLVGLVLLLVGIASAVLLVLDVVLGRGWAVAGCALVALLAVGLWFAMPARRRAASGR